MNIGQTVRAMLGEVRPAEAKTLELKAGQVVRGVVSEMVSDTEAIVTISGVPVRAKLATPLMQGETALLQVQPETQEGMLVLKPMESSTIRITEQSLPDLLRGFGLKDTAVNRELLQFLHKEGVPLTAETVQAFANALKLAPAAANPEGWRDAALLAVRKGLPLTAGTLTALDAVLNGKAMHETLGRLTGEAERFLGAAGSGDSSAAALVKQIRVVLGTVAALVEQGVGQGAGSGGSAAIAQGTAGAAQSAGPVQQGAGAQPAAAGAAGASVAAQPGADVGGASLVAGQASGAVQQGAGAQPAAAGAAGAAQPGAGAGAASPEAGRAGGAAQGAGAAGTTQSTGAAGGMAQPGSVSQAAAQADGIAQGGGATGAVTAQPQSSDSAAGGASPAAGQASGAAQGAGAQPGASGAAQPGVGEGGASPVAGQASGAAQGAGAVQGAGPQPETAGGVKADGWIGRMLTSLGVSHEHGLGKLPSLAQHHVTEAGAEGGGTSELHRSLKGLLLQAAEHPDLPPALREAAQQAVQQITGQQLLLTPDRAAMFSHVTVLVPFYNESGEQTAAVHIESRTGKRGELDAANCHLLFDLALQQVGNMLIDVQVTDRIVSLKVHNDHAAIPPLLEGLREEMAAAMSGAGYQLSSLQTAPYPDKSAYTDLSGGESAARSRKDFYPAKPYKGMDIRV